jgi:glycosyltransferase involved in cell wall biosynthesis
VNHETAFQAECEMGNYADKPSKPLVIIIFSSQLWDDMNWTNKQHLATHLASAGHKVIYVNPSLFNIIARYNLTHRWRSYLAGKSGFPHALVPDRKNLWVYQPAILPFRNKSFVWNSNLYLIKNWVVPRIMRMARRIRGGSDTPIIAWVYLPEIAPDVIRQSFDLFVYDCVDDVWEFPLYKSNNEARRLLEAGEEALLKKADVVFATTPSLYQYLSPQNPHTFLVPNVADAQFFAQAQNPRLPVPEDLAKIPHPRIGFVGAVAEYKLDLSLIRGVAERQPHWHWVLVGHVNETDNSRPSLGNIANIHLLGHRPYSQLPAYIKGFDICAIPYQANKYITSCFPIKFFEYLASGKPTITTPIPALLKYRRLVLIAKDVSSFIRETEKLLRRDNSKTRQARIALSFANTWEKRMHNMLEIIYERLEEKESHSLERNRSLAKSIPPPSRSAGC